MSRNLFLSCLLVGFLAGGGFARNPSENNPETQTESMVFRGYTPHRGDNASWTLHDCLAYGLNNHPSLVQTDGALKSAKARIGQVRAGLGTKVALQNSFSRQRSEYRRALQQARGLTGSDDLIDSTSESLSVRKTLIDAGRTKQRLASAKFSIQAAQADFGWKEVQTASDIKAAFFRVQQAKVLVQVQKDTLNGYKDHLEKVKGFVEVGSRPPYDITKAEVDVANSQVAVIRAENNFQNALSDLVKTVGFDGEIQVVDPDTASMPSMPEPDRGKLVSEAMSRFDLQSVRYNFEATLHQLAEVRRGLKPTLSGSANYDWSGSVTPLDRSWNIGLAVTVPVLDGKLTRYQVREAEGNVQNFKGKVDQFRQAVRAEVEIAVNGVAEAFRRFDASEVLLRQASESLHLAEGRYEAGVGSPIEITDARSAFSGAKGGRVTAYFDSLIALSALDKSLGRLPVELQETSEAASESVLIGEGPAESKVEAK